MTTYIVYVYVIRIYVVYANAKMWYIMLQIPEYNRRWLWLGTFVFSTYYVHPQPSMCSICTSGMRVNFLMIISADTPTPNHISTFLRSLRTYSWIRISRNVENLFRFENYITIGLYAFQYRRRKKVNITFLEGFEIGILRRQNLPQGIF